jgi:hypothetical protein
VFTLLAPPVALREKLEDGDMTDAWKEQREAIARRNSEAQKRAMSVTRARATEVAASARQENERETQQLRDLNERISKQQTRGRS